MRRMTKLVLGLTLSGCATTPPMIGDAETRAWWALTGALSNDGMEGRDTGSPGYDRAATFVAERFRAVGLKPAGDAGTYFQSIALREIRIDESATTFALIGADGQAQRLRFLEDLTIGATVNLPSIIDAPLAFGGYCRTSDLAAARGKIIVCFNTRRGGMATASERVTAATSAGAAGIIQVDDPYFAVEPPRWPLAYARSVEPTDTVARMMPSPPVMRFNPEAFAHLIRGSGRDAATLLATGGRGEPLPSFEIPMRLRATIARRSANIVSSNVLAVLPGTDPSLRDQYLVVGAHLDGYGRGTPIGGDGLYNGTFDNAAYVATLLRLAEQRRGLGFRRSILFAVFTGEEKGLIGSRWLIRHLPVPKAKVVGMVNLDQLRPIFPLDILTVHGMEDSSIGKDAQLVAISMGIRPRLDPEPERNLIGRSDHWPFLQADVPAVNFVFGYEPGTDAERRYRLWYRTRYHHPGDDLTQPWDPVAAAKFNTFFYRLTQRVADAAERPAFVKPNPYRATSSR